MSLIGYARVSTAEGRQVLDRQLDALNEAGCERVFEGPRLYGQYVLDRARVREKPTPLVEILFSPEPPPSPPGTERQEHHSG